MRWSDQDFEFALELQREGMSIRAISLKLDIPYSTLRTRLMKATQAQQSGAESTEQLRLRVAELESKLDEHIKRSHLMLKRFEKAEADRKDKEASEPNSFKLFSKQ